MPTDRQLVSQVHIPRMTGGGAEVRAGQRVKIIAVQGKQIADLFAFVLDSPDEYLSPGHTRRKARSIYPVLGAPLYSNKRNPLLLLEEDTVGVHDLLSPACDYYLYKDLGFDEHSSCRGNLVATLERFNVTAPSLPDPHNIFQNTPIVDLAGRQEVRESPSKAGDYVLLEALQDLLVIVAACSKWTKDRPTAAIRRTSCSRCMSKAPFIRFGLAVMKQYAGAGIKGVGNSSQSIEELGTMGFGGEIMRRSRRDTE